jgi:hypothetical protein
MIKIFDCIIGEFLQEIFHFVWGSVHVGKVVDCGLVNHPLDSGDEDEGC